MPQTARRVKDLDRLVGQRLKQWRVSHGMSQKQIAAVAGITYQQLHKYEQGVNRISAGTLAHLCVELDIPISEVFGGMDLFLGDYVEHNRSLLSLMRDFGQITDARHRELVCQIVRALSANTPQPPATLDYVEERDMAVVA